MNECKSNCLSGLVNKGCNSLWDFDWPSLPRLPSLPLSTRTAGSFICCKLPCLGLVSHRVFYSHLFVAFPFECENRTCQMPVPVHVCMCVCRCLDICEPQRPLVVRPISEMSLITCCSFPLARLFSHAMENFVLSQIIDHEVEAGGEWLSAVRWWEEGGTSWIVQIKDSVGRIWQ